MNRRDFLGWLGKGSAAVVVVPALALALVERYVTKPAMVVRHIDPMPNPRWTPYPALGPGRRQPKIYAGEIRYWIEDYATKWTP